MIEDYSGPCMIRTPDLLPFGILEGVTIPLIVEKFASKTANAINMIFAINIKILWTTVEIIFETLSAKGFHVTIIRGIVYNNSVIFEVFGNISASFDISSWHIFWYQLLLSSCDRHQKFHYGCSNYPRNESRFWPFFNNCYKSLAYWSFYKKIVQCM